METHTSIALGDIELDDQHALFELQIQMLACAPHNEVVHVLSDLRAHAADHFAHEDAEIKRLKPSNGRCHLDEHQAVLKSMDEVIARLSGDEGTPELAEFFKKDLSFELMRWLPEHVNEMDRAIATLRAQQRYGGSVIKPYRMTRNKTELTV